MKARAQRPQERDRRDHYVPQGYLRGFVDAGRAHLARPLWVLDIQRNEWAERSTSQIGWGRGFYDYAEGSSPDATADEAFLPFENRFPQIRERIRIDGYATWTQHRDLLVSFSAMLAARSPLFREQAVSQITPSLTDDPRRNVLAKNFSITLMRTELRNRPESWQQYHWVLGYTTDPCYPFVASDQVVGMWGNAPDLAEAYTRNDFWLWCPLSWDMCLIASSQPLANEPTSELRPEHVAELQMLAKRQATAFIAAPRLLPSLGVTSSGRAF